MAQDLSKKHPSQLPIYSEPWAEAEIHHKGSQADPVAREIDLHRRAKAQKENTPSEGEKISGRKKV